MVVRRSPGLSSLKNRKEAMRIVAGDIGGTKTLLQLVQVNPVGREVLLERRYQSGAYPSFQSMLREFLSLDAGPVRSACFAVAGPVLDGRAELTNLGWVMTTAQLREEFGINSVALLNDFFAIAVGVPLLTADDVVSVQKGRRDRSMPIAILGAGTGLGEAVVVPVEGGWRVVPSEGGHADFAPRDEVQSRLLGVLRERYGHVSWERLVSGQGLVNIFTFLRDHENPEQALVCELIMGDSMPARLSELAREGDPLAKRTFEMFVEIYGAEAGNLALKVLARGGVYLAGGIAGKNLEWFTDGRFIAAFRDKGRFAEVMDDMPVDLITNPNVGLIGAVDIAIRQALG